jgi:hypothetical protein
MQVPGQAWTGGRRPRISEDRPVKFYGVASRISLDVDEWHLSRDEAEAALAEVLADERDLAGALYIAVVELVTSNN